MRVTTGMTADNAIYNLQQQRTILDTLQGQVSSGNNINKPSDDPLTTRQLLDVENQIKTGDQYSSNITKGSLLLNVASTALTGMSSLMTQVKQLASSLTNGSNDPTALSNAAKSLQQFKAQIIDLGNTQIGGQYVFGGFASSAPFDAAGNFSGTSDSFNLEIIQGSSIATNVDGGALLRGGTPPAAVGSGATAGGSPVDVLGSLDALINAVQSNNASGISDGLKNMQTATSQINAVVSDVAGRMTRMTNVQTMITNNQNTLKGILGDKQNVDYAKLGVQISQQTTAFNAALSATAKISQLSLLNYLQ